MDYEHVIDFHPLPVEGPARERAVFASVGRATHRGLYTGVVKRALDIVVSSVALLLLSPAFAVIAIAIELDSPGPVFFRSRRVGYRGRALPMLKFRKMHDDATGLPLTADRDPRLTRIGRILTERRLDELPQLWDVLRGRMSLIGPRPEDPAFVALHQDGYEHILTVRPGITGLSQIAYKLETRIVDPSRAIDDYTERILPQKLILDGLYATRCSLRLDLQVVYWSMMTLLLGVPVSVHRITGRMSRRRGRPRPGPPPQGGGAPVAAPEPVPAHDGADEPQLAD